MHDAFLLTTINLRRGRVRKKRKSRRSGFHQVLPKKDREREATVSGPYSVVPILELWKTDSKNDQNLGAILKELYSKLCVSTFVKLWPVPCLRPLGHSRGSQIMGSKSLVLVI